MLNGHNRAPAQNIGKILSRPSVPDEPIITNDRDRETLQRPPAVTLPIRIRPHRHWRIPLRY
jgi:hypothetical protein